MDDVEVIPSWTECCSYIRPISARARHWVASLAPLEPRWLAISVVLEPEGQPTDSVTTTTIAALDVLCREMKRVGLRVRRLPVSPKQKNWRRETEKIARAVVAGTRGWAPPEMDQGFYEAMRRYYKQK